jgi:hypothetical protein
MTRFRAPLLASALALLVPASVAGAQQGSVAVTATVRALPLSLVDVRRTAVPGELLVRVVGCGEGALTVDARTAVGTIRTVRLPLPASSGCSMRDASIHLADLSMTASEYLVSLDHSDRLLAPSFSQFVIPAGIVRPGARASVAY